MARMLKKNNNDAKPFSSNVFSKNREPPLTPNRWRIPFRLAALSEEANILNQRPGPNKHPPYLGLKCELIRPLQS